MGAQVGIEISFVNQFIQFIRVSLYTSICLARIRGEPPDVALSKDELERASSSRVQILRIRVTEQCSVVSYGNTLRPLDKM